MKRIILSFIFLYVTCLFLHSQICNAVYTTGSDIYTCNSISIQTKTPSCEWSVPEKATRKSEVLAEYASKGITNSDILEDASTAYNCHAYAWHLTEGHTNNVWINQTIGSSGANLNKYWTGTNSCFLSTTEADAEKIFYYSGDHSAVKSTNGKYISKWGQLPLIRHSPTSVPDAYIGSNRQYYRHRPSISGSTLVCTSGATFTISNPPTGYTWTQSSNLNAGTTSGNTKTFTAKSGSAYYGPGWVAINIGTVEVARKEVWVGVPVISDITGPTSHPTYQTTTYQAIFPSALANPTSYQWTLSPQNGNSTYSYGSDFDVTFYTSGSYQVVCRATNACGQGAYFVLDVDVYNSIGYSSAYPNPVSNLLNIEFNQEAIAQTQEARQTKPVKQKMTFDIRLYDSQGNQIRNAVSKGEKVAFDVSNLLNGIYFLHVYDGIKENPEVHKIVVKH